MIPHIVPFIPILRTDMSRLFSSSLPTECMVDTDQYSHEWESLHCCICSEPAHTPVMCQNVERPHLFCAGCVEQYVQINGPRTIRCFIDSESPYVDTLLMSLPEPSLRQYMVILDSKNHQLKVEITHCPIPVSDYLLWIKCPICRIECTQFSLACSKLSQLNHRTVWCRTCERPIQWDQVSDHEKKCHHPDPDGPMFSFGAIKRKRRPQEEEEVPNLQHEVLVDGKSQGGTDDLGDNVLDGTL